MKDKFIEKYAALRALRLTHPLVWWRGLIPTREKLMEFYEDAKDLSWPENYGQSPWDDVFNIAYDVKHGVSPSAAEWYAKTHPENPNRLAILEAFGVKTTLIRDILIRDNAPVSLSVRLTHQFNTAWADHDRSHDIGDAKIIRSGLRHWRHESFREFIVLEVNATGYRKVNIERSLHESLAWACRCEHDCCGCTFGGVSRLRHLAGNRIAVMLTGSKNV